MKICSKLSTYLDVEVHIAYWWSEIYGALVVNYVLIACILNLFYLGFHFLLLLMDLVFWYFL